MWKCAWDPVSKAHQSHGTSINPTAASKRKATTRNGGGWTRALFVNCSSDFFDYSPHLCVGFLFLVVYSRPPPPYSHTTYSHTQLTHTPLIHTRNLPTHNLLTHRLPTHNLPTHTQLTLTQLTHTQLTQTHTHTLPTTTYSHTTCPHTTYSHTTYPHTTYTHTPTHTHLTHTPLTHTQLTHTHTHTQPTHRPLTHTQLAHTPLQIWWCPKIGAPPAAEPSSILVGLSLMNHPFAGTPILGNLHIDHRGMIRQCLVHLRWFSLLSHPRTRGHVRCKWWKGVKDTSQ